MADEQTTTTTTQTTETQASPDESKSPEVRNPDALLRSLEQLKREKSELRAKADELDALKARLADEERQREAEKAKAEGRWGDIERSLKDQAAKERADLERRFGEETTRRDAVIERLVLGGAAMDVARSISDVPDLLADARVRPRLKLEWDEGTPKVRVLSRDGRDTGMSLDDLAKELAQDPALAKVITTSRASGSGSSGARPGAEGRKIIRRADYEALSLKERSELLKARVTVVD